MSGICGIIQLDGAPLDRSRLELMTSFMAFRGPDAQDNWVDGSVGFGHTLLCTTFESELEHQPRSLDGRVWITADARIDGREELKSKLRAGHRLDLAKATDVDLILHAYQLWGADCVEHLIGDFAFAIWDGRRRQLFCARDHFGVKPFFYALVGQQLIFSNTLNCVRQHPAVSSTLNDLAIADFLLFGENKEPATTAFADIQRLLPAHALTWTAGSGLQVRRYWRLPTDLGVRHRLAGDYLEHFKELLDIAVADRLRTNRVGVEMSGGLDSSSIAAAALGVLSRQSQPYALQAQSIVYDYLIPDQERHFSGLVAQHLGIPIRYIIADKHKLYANWDQPETWSPEPFHCPQAAMHADAFRGAAAFGRVFLTGWDGDALLSESLRPHFRALATKRQYARLAYGLFSFAVSQRRLVPLGWLNWLKGRLATGRARTAPDEDYPAFLRYPEWLNPELEVRFQLRDRWRQHRVPPEVEHPVRSYAYTCYQYLAQNPGFFESYDAGATGLPLEYRHPLMDLRLLDFCLALPLQPWVVKKHILREAMRGALPEAVRKRPKSCLAGSPWEEMVKLGSKGIVHDIPTMPMLGTYVNPAMICDIESLKGDLPASWLNLRPLSLQSWLVGSYQKHIN